MSDEIIIQELKYKEAQLLNELNKVRLALKAFINENVNFGNENFQSKNDNSEIPQAFDKTLTYGSKILFILNKENRPMLVEEIIAVLHGHEPELDISKLHKTISYNLSMLAKYNKLKKHPFNRFIKYSI
jgi:hypothetical protein